MEPTRLPLLLRGNYQYVSAHQDTDFQLRMYSLGVERPSDMVPGDCIVIFTSSDDRETTELSLSLAAEGVRLVRVNSDDSELPVIEGIDDNGKLIVGSERLWPRVFWRRRFEIGSSERDDSPLVRAYRRTQLDALAETISDAASLRVNGRVACTSRLAQLRVAKESGFNTPRTVVTREVGTTAQELRNAWGDIFVVKPVGSHWTQHPSGVLNGTFPAVFRTDELSLEVTEPVPVLLQEYITHAFEVRVYVIGDHEPIAYRVDGKTTAQDLWVNQGRIDARSYTLPPTVSASIRALQSAMRIDMGAIDLLCGDSGRFTFLEVNLSGDWRYFEKAAGDRRVSESVLRFVSEQVQDEA